MPSLKKGKKRPWIPVKKRTEPNLTDNSSFYNSRKWRALRNYFIQLNPLCAQCKRNNILTSGQCVDHIRPIRLGGKLTDISNLQTLCNSCHAKKSGSEAHDIEYSIKK